ncbi:MAG: RNA polymerase sigma factor [Clostridia bacterium]|nr:RNA polymerase sigma factor [Clostridia bacterium]
MNKAAPDPVARPAFDQLIELYGNRLTRMCFLYLRDYALAEDAVQETFLRAYRSYSSFRQNSSVQTWLTRIAINVCHNIRRTHWFRLRNSPSLEDVPLAVEPCEPRDDTVLQQVMALPPKCREVILLHYYQGFKIAEIAEMLSVSESAVGTRLKRARDKLRPQLEGWYFDEE